MVPHVVLLTIAFSVVLWTTEFTMWRCCCEAQVREGLEVNDVFLTQDRLSLLRFSVPHAPSLVTDRLHAH